MTTGALAMVRCLELEGVKTAFGYPGAAICPFYDALAGSPIHHVLVRTEQNAAHAASGYARISGEVGVCIATSGPGATNLLTGIASAYMDSIPLVVITGQVRSDLLGRDVFQEADITGAAEPFTKHSYIVSRASDIPRIFKEAFHIASTGRPGPVLIDVPIDMQQKSIPDFDYSRPVDIIGYKPRVQGHSLQIKKAVDALLNAGVVLKNQTVLLKGVNDDGRTMGELLKGLTRWGIAPYYIFQCRPVSGVKSQFQIPLTEGCRIVEEAKNMQNGQGKCIRYAMSHVTGKIEILGQMPDKNMLFKYHQAKYEKDQGRIFCEKLAPGQAWLQG